MAKLKLNFPNRPIGAKVMIPGIKGDFENGGEYEVEELTEDLVLPVGSTEKPKRTDKSIDVNKGDDQ